MPLILITNDDGIHSAGIRKLEEKLCLLGDVLVVAPSHEMSAASHALTVSRPLRIDKIDDRHFAVDGTPVDCVTLALCKILTSRLPDLIVSGINHGANVGDDVLYSGTVAGALEASVYGLPGIAFSQVGRKNIDFGPAAQFALQVVNKALEKGLPERTILNINVPQSVKGVRVTHQGTRVIRTRIHEGTDPRGRTYYWIGEELSTWHHEEMSDYEAVQAGYISITPLQNNLTNTPVMQDIERWQLQTDEFCQLQG